MKFMERLLRTLLRRTGCPPSSPRNTLVVAAAFLGDVVVLGPFLRALRKTYPLSRINLLIEASGEYLTRGNRKIDRDILFDKYKRWNPLYLLKFAGHMRGEKFDLALVHYAHFQFERNPNIVYHNFTNAKYRFLQDAAARQYSLLPIDALILFFIRSGTSCTLESSVFANATPEGSGEGEKH